MAKIKAKTKKIAAKRFKITKSGKILRSKQNSRHLKLAKSKKQKRKYKVKGQVSATQAKMVRRLLPYA